MGYFKYYKLFLKIFYFYYCNKNFYNKNSFLKKSLKKLILNLINKSYKDKNKNFYLSYLKFITFKFLITFLKKIYLFHKNILIKYYLTCSMINFNSRISAKVAKLLKLFLRREDPMKL